MGKKWLFWKTLALALFPIFFTSLSAQTIAEKKEGIVEQGDLTPDMQKFLVEVNRDISSWQEKLNDLYAEVLELYQNQAPEETYLPLVDEIQTIKENIILLENNWRKLSSGNNLESYGLWHQPETTLGQLLIDYGSQSFVYLMSQEIAKTKLSVASNIPIPRASWNEMIDLILSQNGFGVKQLNAYLREVYVLKDDLSSIELITNKRNDLEVLPSETRVAFVLSPEPSDVKRISFFLDKFVNSKMVTFQTIGRDLLVVGSVAQVQEMIKLYDFIALNRGDKEYKTIPISRVDAAEMAKILAAIFDQLAPEASGPAPKGKPLRPEDAGKGKSSGDAYGLKVIPLDKVAQAIFLVGTRDEIRKAEVIIKEVENQVGEASERIIFTYRVKHSEADELAVILEKVYGLMIKTGAGLERFRQRHNQELVRQGQLNVNANESVASLLAGQSPPPIGLYDEGFYLSDKFIVNPYPGEPRPIREKNPNLSRNNFIVDPKTNSIVMVIEVEAVQKIKELIHKLDVPKKMVQIEVLLFEKKLTKQDNFGLNLLKVGNCASNTDYSCGLFNDITSSPLNLGVFQFLLSRKESSGLPAYDLAYKFLLSQDDIQINASPSVVAINKTQAKIEIDEEISVSTGIFILPIEGGNTTKDAFARARYGIKIAITPTIHMSEGDDDDDCFVEEVPDYITLDTDILFETPGIDPLAPNRPPVTRRRIVNQVRIQDGQTVILGGLRKKITEDSGDQIPYLGEIPGFGKLFSTSSVSQASTETFIFLTPRIISDPGEDMERIKRIEMTRRPGDIPEFLCRLVEARQAEKNLLFQETMTILFGPPPERCYSPYGEFELPEDFLGDCYDD